MGTEPQNLSDIRQAAPDLETLRTLATSAATRLREDESGLEAADRMAAALWLALGDDHPDILGVLEDALAYIIAKTPDATAPAGDLEHPSMRWWADGRLMSGFRAHTLEDALAAVQFDDADGETLALLERVAESDPAVAKDLAHALDCRRAGRNAVKRARIRDLMGDWSGLPIAARDLPDMSDTARRAITALLDTAIDSPVRDQRQHLTLPTGPELALAPVPDSDWVLVLVSDLSGANEGALNIGDTTYALNPHGVGRAFTLVPDDCSGEANLVMDGDRHDFTWPSEIA